MILMESGKAISMKQSMDAVPANRDNYRFSVVSRYMIIFSFLGHVLFICIYILLGIYIMSVINVISCFIWLVSFFFIGQKLYRTAFYIGVFEIIMHAMLSVYFVGWGPGFQYYIICLIPFLFFVPSRRNLFQFLGGAAISLSYLALYYYAARFPGQYRLEAVYVELLHYYNSSMACIAFILFSFYYNRAVRKVEGELNEEYKRSEALLLNILPESIAEKLKSSTAKTFAERYENVTVLFADLVGFTRLCSKIPPETTVKILNRIFSLFDNLVDKYGLEKIKTIGDSYMLAGGIPESCDRHAEYCARIALEMLDKIAALDSRYKLKLGIRIGINSGPVVAGVIGVKKFIYDLWGDTVNIASRMESHGEPGKIHCSENTYNLIKDKFFFEPRGEVIIKGKGKMKTYYLKGTQNAPVIQVIQENITT